jgi:PAS domain S-box-containing protein
MPPHLSAAFKIHRTPEIAMKMCFGYLPLNPSEMVGLDPARSGRLHGAAPAESILESISDGIFTVNADWRITFFNRAAEAITGIPRRDALGKRCRDILRADMCDGNCALRQTIATGIPVINKTANIINTEGERIPISVSTALIRGSNFEVIGGGVAFRDLTLVEKLARELQGCCQIGDMLSRSFAMRKITDILPQIAASESTVLIQGETGTGKELLVRAIHSLGSRSQKPLVALNCGALPDTLLESELFGYKTGAFTGANKDKLGRFGLAEGGILFLDEIGEISPALQIRLLRVLQERIYEPLGSTQSVKSDVRVIAATNSNLSALVAEGKFRRDLFYRINVIRVDLPPLRERKEDIPLLVDHFISRFNRLQRKSIMGVCNETMALLMDHDFPGNCRELENIIEHAFVLCSEPYITPDYLPPELVEGGPCKPPEIAREDNSMENVVQAVEAQTIKNALKRNNFNRLAAARDLGIHKSTLFRKIKTLGITLPHTNGRFRYPNAGKDLE